MLITTRNEHIAVDARSDCYKLQLLDEDKSWELFLNKVGSAAATWAGLEEFKEGIVAMVQSRGIGRRLGRSRDVTVAVYQSRIGRYAK